MFIQSSMAAEMCSIDGLNDQVKAYLAKENVSQDKLIAGYDSLNGGKTKAPYTHRENINRAKDQLEFAAEKDKGFYNQSVGTAYRHSATANNLAGNHGKAIEDYKQAAKYFEKKVGNQKINFTKDGDIKMSNELYDAFVANTQSGQTANAIKLVSPNNYGEMARRINANWKPNFTKATTNSEKIAVRIEWYQTRKVQLELAEKANDRAIISEINNELPALRREIESLSRAM